MPGLSLLSLSGPQKEGGENKTYFEIENEGGGGKKAPQDKTQERNKNAAFEGGKRGLLYKGYSLKLWINDHQEVLKGIFLWILFFNKCGSF